MGLARGAIKMIAETIRDYHLRGRVLVIGKQDVWGTGQEVKRWLADSGLSPQAGTVELSLKGPLRDRGFVQDISVFQLMGFQEVVTLDNSDFEGAQVIHDLNLAVTEPMLARVGRFDLVIDSGCLEHVFDVSQVLSNFFTLAKVNGVIIHISPSTNHIDHGFYMFSPTLFQDYYGANQFKILRHLLFQYRHPLSRRKWKAYHYLPGALAPFSFGGMPKGLFGIFIAAQKQAHSTCNAVVQQSAYRAAWSQNRAAQQPSRNQNRLQRIARHVPTRLVPFLQSFYDKTRTVGGLGRYLDHYQDL